MTSVLALTGGVGGAKLALGLARVLPPEEFEKLLLPRQRTASLSVLSLAPAQNYD